MVSLVCIYTIRERANTLMNKYTKIIKVCLGFQLVCCILAIVTLIISGFSKQLIILVLLPVCSTISTGQIYLSMKNARK